MSQVIEVRGAREHNLKNIDVVLPRNRLVVVTGPSGSGKSTLAFDTIYAEGQRRYVQSLSAYARQFLGVLNRPAVDDISGLSPAISIEQKGVSHNPRSTVGTVTEIYDYLRLLFGRAGTPYCPDCGCPVERHSLDEIVEHVLHSFEGERVEILAPLVKGKKGEHRNVFLRVRQKGYMRIRVDGTVLWLEEEISLDKNRRHSIEVVVDRLKAEKDRRDRLGEAVEAALSLSGGEVLLVIPGRAEELLTEKDVCTRCGFSLPEVEPRLFSFNAPQGACPDCSGLGSHEHFDEEMAVDPDRSVVDGALLPWKKNHYMLNRLTALATNQGWDLSRPYRSLPQALREAILHGHPEKLDLTYRERGEEFPYRGRYEGLLVWLERRWSETESETVKEELAGFRAEDLCSACRGLRLRKEALAVRLGDYGIGDIVSMPVSEVLSVLRKISLAPAVAPVVAPVVEEVAKRLSFLVDVGVGYLTLHRRADTLSGGESQRIRLATQIGSKLSGVLYVLDEPTVGLHPRDTGRLLKTLLAIRDLGNTVLVVEHDRDTMIAADYIVEMGPGAGERGGFVVAAGTAQSLARGESLTAPYIKGETSGVVLPGGGRRRPQGWLTVRGAAEHNLSDIDVAFPLGTLTVLSGVSGSGKSTLLYDVLYKGLRRRMDRNFRGRAGRHRDIEGLEELKNVVLVDQSPIGRTPRSNPATYTGLFTPIRELFAQLPEAKIRGYGPGRFSFNVRGGRCEACGGDGVTRVSMLFMADVFVTCDVCGGRRFNRETLDIRYRGKTIADVLDMTVEEAALFFRDHRRIAHRLDVLAEAGLGYIRLGQSATTLSGGEAQRVKLATELGKRFNGQTLYLLDEPTTGLHYTDVAKLLRLLHRLVDQGNSVILIEHNLDVLASSDYIIDLGPEGGQGGGHLVAAGEPQSLLDVRGSFTAQHLRAFMEEQKGGLFAHVG
ncbi:excinuclease ABC subunit UvrA [Aminirod propionatiphilus]|uniref:Excinuclease ABC subunit UvrA n=1 Tax=Aminirod propionatiphilus TaxID=3415223 RepID=A0ACD1DZ40_9BACT|nr:excinuclease ABC subunit UvrA [Synergistota bacterium]